MPCQGQIEGQIAKVTKVNSISHPRWSWVLKLNVISLTVELCLYQTVKVTAATINFITCIQGISPICLKKASMLRPSSNSV